MIGRALNWAGWRILTYGAGRVPVPRYVVVGQWLIGHTPQHH